MSRELTFTFNDVYTDLIDDTNRYIIVKGSAGSGKSYAIAKTKFIQCLVPSYGKRKVLAMRKVGATLKDSVYSLFKELIEEYELSGKVKVNKTEKTFYFPDGSEIHCLGLDDPEKIKSIHGVTDIWMEEATEFNVDDWRQLSLRLRGKGIKRQFVLSFNPVSVHSWIKAEFYDKEKPDTKFYNTTYKDNAYLDDEYIKELERLKDIDQYHYQVYVLGEWGNIDSAKIFHNYVVHDFEIEERLVDAGLDWGFNDPTAYIESYENDQELYIVYEYYHTGKTNTDRISDLEDKKGQRIIADSSEPASIHEFKRAGFKITGAVKGKDSIKAGLDYLRRYRKIHIHKSRCPNTAREFELYKYKETKDGITDEPLDLNNHAIDALRYSKEPYWKKPTRRENKLTVRI